MNKITLKFVPKGPINKISALVQIIAKATSHYLNQWWLVYWRIYASLDLSELRPTQIDCRFEDNFLDAFPVMNVIEIIVQFHWNLFPSFCFKISFLWYLRWVSRRTLPESMMVWVTHVYMHPLVSMLYVGFTLSNGIPVCQETSNSTWTD